MPAVKAGPSEAGEGHAAGRGVALAAFRSGCAQGRSSPLPSGPQDAGPFKQVELPARKHGRCAVRGTRMSQDASADATSGCSSGLAEG